MMCETDMVNYCCVYKIDLIYINIIMETYKTAFQNAENNISTVVTNFNTLYNGYDCRLSSDETNIKKTLPLIEQLSTN